mmetsp:Transcript_35160/g.83985  ORF Transcript_35160/g.83985 Transcript_35160/m.83985 type:complete len:525 (-) Transcript_35160:151-1725(-)
MTMDERLTSLVELLSADARGRADVEALLGRVENIDDELDELVSLLVDRVFGDRQDDGSLSVLTYLVERNPNLYLARTSRKIRDVVRARELPFLFITDNLLLQLAKLIVGPDSDNQTSASVDARDALFRLCAEPYRQQSIQNTKQTLGNLENLWQYLLNQKDAAARRKSSSLVIRIASFMVDLCMLGGDVFALADEGGEASVMGKLITLVSSKEDPLMQASALDQLGRLAAFPMTNERASFLLGNKSLHNCLFALIEADLNGEAALRVITDICGVGINAPVSLDADTRKQFTDLLRKLHLRLQNTHPYGELEQLSYINAVSSLVTASLTPGSSSDSETIMNDSRLISGWLSLQSLTRPRLKGVTLSSLAQAIEPSMRLSNPGDDPSARPSDRMVIKLLQTFGEANDHRDPTELLIASAKAPFIEERLGSVDVIRALSMRGASLRMMLLYNGGTEGCTFVDWLMDEENDPTREGKKAKYELISSMLECNSTIIEGVLPSAVVRELLEWKKGGPSHRRRISWEMATQ